MQCKNMHLCKRKYERWKYNQSKFIPIGEQEHETFLKYAAKNEAILRIKTYPEEEKAHAEKRQFERAVSLNDIKDIITYGWIIERNFFPDKQETRLVILGYTKRFRPLHVVCEVVTEKHWEIVTVYSPESKTYKWANNFQERICFCKHDEGELV